MNAKEMKELNEVSHFLGKTVESLLKLDEEKVRELVEMWDEDPMKVHSLAYSL